jgi:hypothetical protein
MILPASFIACPFYELKTATTMPAEYILAALSSSKVSPDYLPSGSEMQLGKKRPQ